MAEVVTRENFVRAETDTYLASMVAAAGGVGRFEHKRELTPIDRQVVVRSNRDTLYSNAVFDLDAGPVAVVMPDAGGRFMSLLAINQDHYALGTTYCPGPRCFTRDEVGTRYLFLLVRTFVDPGDQADVAAVHALQDAIRVEASGVGAFDTPDWDEASLAQVRDGLRQEPTFDTRRAFGRRDEVDPLDHLIGTARGWGGNPARDAIYVSGKAADNDGVTPYQLTVRDVPVDGFWSVSVYDKDGFFAPNEKGAHSLNNITAIPDLDGGYTIRFGGCDGGAANCLPITPGWNYTVRLYRPRAQLLSGIWRFPDAQPPDHP